MADIDIQEVQKASPSDAGHQLAEFVNFVSALSRLAPIDSDAERHAGTDRIPNPAQHLTHEIASSLGGSAPLIGSLVRRRRQKNVRKRLVGAVNLDSISTRLLRFRRTRRVCVQNELDMLFCHGMRYEIV
jgi:hypothetical protein